MFCVSSELQLLFGLSAKKKKKQDMIKPKFAVQLINEVILTVLGKMIQFKFYVKSR
jgi:hypothetical protein